MDEPCPMERGSWATSAPSAQAVSYQQDKNTYKWYNGASVQQVITSWTGLRLLLLKGSALSGLSEDSLEGWDVC